MDGVPASEDRIHDAAGRPTMRSTDLFQGGKEIVIRHGSEEYRLRITRAGKLILTK
jgi:hemin uptake protein HemP